MKPSRPDQQQQEPIPGHAAPTMPWSQDGSHQAPPMSGPQTPTPADHPGNVTVFRAGNFFVHAIARLNQQRTSALRNASGNTGILEQLRWVSAEKQRMTEVGTRLLPEIEVIHSVQAKEIPIPAWLEGIVIAIGLLIALGTHAFNLFQYPFYQAVEGTSMADAWAVLHGMFQPYTYTYTQPPLGWVQIAGWIQLTGGFFSFGNALNSGRILMLLYLLGSSLLVYIITTRLSGSRSAALLAMIIFSLSPLGATYQREVLLENIGIFWLLLSLCLMVIGESRLPYILFAGISLGIAILTKGSFIVFLPAMLYAAWLHATTFQRKFMLVVFTYASISVASSFILLALLNDAFFPMDFLPWDHHTHQSMITTFIAHIRYPSNPDSFVSSWSAWKQSDLFLIIASAVAIALNLIAGWMNRMHWLLAFLAISFWAFLLLGSDVHPYTIVPLLPLLSINIAIAANAPVKWLCHYIGFDLVRALLIFILIGALVPYTIQYTLPTIVQNQTAPQTNTLSWIRNNVPLKSVVLINSYLYTDLHEANDEGGVYLQAHPYTNATLDPSVYDVLFKEDWQRIDYIVVDAQMRHDIATPTGTLSTGPTSTGSKSTGPTPTAPTLFLNRVIHHSLLRVTYQSNDHNPDETIQIYQVIHT